MASEAAAIASSSSEGPQTVGNGGRGSTGNESGTFAGVPTKTNSFAIPGSNPSKSFETGATLGKNGNKGQKINRSDSGIGRGAGSGNQFMQQLPEMSAGLQSQSRGNAGNSTRGFKDMVEVIKKMHGDADKLQERISRLHCQFAEVTLKGAFLFDPKTIQILSDDYSEIGGLPDPEETHFTRQSVNDSYIELSQMVNNRPIPEPEF